MSAEWDTGLFLIGGALAASFTAALAPLVYLSAKAAVPHILRWYNARADARARRREYLRRRAGGRASWQCYRCWAPRAVWSRGCPDHAKPGEYEAFLRTPEGQGWRRRMDELGRGRNG